MISLPFMRFMHVYVTLNSLRVWVYLCIFGIYVTFGVMIDGTADCWPSNFLRRGANNLKGQTIIHLENSFCFLISLRHPTSSLELVQPDKRLVFYSCGNWRHG